MTENEVVKCGECGKEKTSPMQFKEFVKCDKCQKTFCLDHIFAGNKQYRNLCSKCLEDCLRVDKSSDGEPIQIKPDHKKEKVIPTTSPVTKTIGLLFPKWEYKVIFLSVDARIDMDFILDSKVKEYNVDKYVFEKEEDPQMLNIDELNKLGDDGWEVICTIPRTTGLMIRHKDAKYFALAGGNITGTYLLLKKEKIDKK